MLETLRCRLDALREEDYNAVKQLYTDEKVRQYLGGIVGEAAYKAKFSKMLEHDADSLYWVIQQRHNGEFIGLISLDLHHDNASREVSYQLLPCWWGYGYGTEAVGKIIEYAFTVLKLPKLVAETQKANTASCRMLEKLGMKLEDTVVRFGAEQNIYGMKMRPAANYME